MYGKNGTLVQAASLRYAEYEVRVFVSSHPLVCLRPSYVHAVDEIARISHLTRSPLRVVNFGVMLIVEFITAG